MTRPELDEHMKSKWGEHMIILICILARLLTGPYSTKLKSSTQNQGKQCEKQQQSTLCVFVNETQLLKVVKKRKELEKKIRRERAVNAAVQHRLQNLKSQLAGDFHATKADNGTILLKISQINHFLAAERNTFSSQPFFLEKCRYKVCFNIRFDLINDEPSMSLYFMIIKGEFDSKLEWPFPHQIIFKVINKTGGRDIIRSLGSQDSPTCAKPDTDKNIVYGCPNIASQAELMRGYITQDDSVFVECEIHYV